MEKMRGILKRIFCLPPLPTILIAATGYLFVILVFVWEIDIPAIQYLSYFCSAYALIVTITGLATHLKMAKRSIHEHPITKKFRETAVAKRYSGDVRFRTEISLYQGLFVNLLYIVIKLISGIYYQSFWFISLAIYYALLALMRFLLLRRGKKRTGRTPMEEEIHRYRLCGIVLLFMNQALMGIVIYMVQKNRGFIYPGYLIYVMALYSFYSIIIAAINMVKFRKHGSPVISAAKAINFVAAMVSILSLETAMIAQFGGEDEAFRITMTGATGGGVCTIVIGMAVYMIWKSAKLIKEAQMNNAQIS